MEGTLSGDKATLVSDGNIYFVHWEDHMNVFDFDGEVTLGKTFTPTLSGKVTLEFYSHGKFVGRVYEDGVKILDKEFPGSSNDSAEITVTKGKKYVLKVCTAPFYNSFTLYRYSIRGGININGWTIVNEKN